MLLLTLHRLALRLRPLRTASAVVTAVGWVAIMWVMVKGEDEHSWFVRATLALSLWALLLFTFTCLFQTLPAPSLPALKWHERLLTRIRLALTYLMTFAFIVLALAVCGMTAKLMMLG